MADQLSRWSVCRLNKHLDKGALGVPAQDLHDVGEETELETVQLQALAARYTGLTRWSRFLNPGVYIYHVNNH